MKRKTSTRPSNAAPKGLEIRRTQSTDAAAIARVFEGPQVIRGTLQLPYPSVEAWQQRLGRETDASLVSLVACDGEDVVGTLGLHLNPGMPRRQHVAELGMAVRDDWQGRGVGTALLKAALELADGWMQLRRLQLTVFVDNAPAVRLYRKFGFEVEGTLRELAYRDGRYVDGFLMARLRPAQT
ncbi:MAG: GNAT family N-acetyltransferase [Verrucomicrobiales bacterium]|nr:GNAT family N-acetyltransferase [Verrucomicrobiales bacterium]